MQLHVTASLKILRQKSGRHFIGALAALERLPGALAGPGRCSRYVAAIRAPPGPLSVGLTRRRLARAPVGSDPASHAPAALSLPDRLCHQTPQTVSCAA